MSPSLTQMFFVRYPPCAEIPRYQRLTLLHRSSSRSRPDSVLNVPRRGRLGSPRTVGDFRQAGQEQRVFLPIVEFDNCGNKEVRIRRLGNLPPAEVAVQDSISGHGAAGAAAPRFSVGRP